MLHILLSLQRMFVWYLLAVLHSLIGSCLFYFCFTDTDQCYEFTNSNFTISDYVKFLLSCNTHVSLTGCFDKALAESLQLCSAFVLYLSLVPSAALIVGTTSDLHFGNSVMHSSFCFTKIAHVSFLSPFSQGEFVEDGTETHFSVGDHSCCIKAVSSGKRKEGIIHTLIVDDREIPEAVE